MDLFVPKRSGTLRMEGRIKLEEMSNGGSCCVGLI